MHFCVSDHVCEWLSQIVLDKVHLRWEIEASRPPGGDPPAQRRSHICNGGKWAARPGATCSIKKRADRPKQA